MSPLSPLSSPAPVRPYQRDQPVYAATLQEPKAHQQQVSEALIHDLWLGQRFNTAALTTTDGQCITILDPGTHNTDSGPDFSNARLMIGTVEWVGDVEIHTTSGRWFTHRHHLDPRYNSAILHVALYADIWTGGLLRPDGSPLPELILFPHLEESLRHLLHQYHTRADNTLTCSAHWPGVPLPVRSQWIARLARERMHQKHQEVARQYRSRLDLEALLHEHLFAGLGYAKNDEPMTRLARRLPVAALRNVTDPLDLEALHLGVAGLLPAPRDLLHADRATADYAVDLCDRFQRLQHRLDVPLMDRASWKFFRLRPANFPPLRIAQGVAWLAPGGLLQDSPLERLAEALIDPKPVRALRRRFSATPGDFWKRHVQLTKATRARNAALGRQRIDALIVNAAIPVLLSYAGQQGRADLEAAAFGVLRRLPAATDAVIRRFEALGTYAHDALTAQGLHQLYRTRCTQGRCLSCAIGRHILERHGTRAA